MSAFHDELDLDRRPEDVWSYVTDPAHLPEWQASAVSATKLDDRPFGVGSKVRVVRHIGRREVPMTMECTEYEQGHAWTMRGVDGPVRGVFHGVIDPIDDGRRTRMTMDLDFEGHGIGRVLVPLLVRSQARREMPRNEQLLKDHLERTAA